MQHPPSTSSLIGPRRHASASVWSGRCAASTPRMPASLRNWRWLIQTRRFGRQPLLRPRCIAMELRSSHCCTSWRTTRPWPFVAKRPTRWDELAMPKPFPLCSIYCSHQLSRPLHRVNPRSLRTTRSIPRISRSCGDPRPDPHRRRGGDTSWLGTNDAHVQRGALIALDQMPDGNLRVDEVTRLVSSANPALQRAAVAILIQHREWATSVAELLDEWLVSGDSWNAERQQTLAETLRAFCGTPEVQQLVQRRLARWTAFPSPRSASSWTPLPRVV